MAITGKKAVFYTFSAILLLVVIFAELLFETNYQVSDENKVVSVKTASLNAFVLGLEQDIERGLFIAGFRALVAADQFITNSNTFLSDAEAGLEEAMFNGSMEGSSVSIMDESTIPEWLSRIEAEALQVGILVNFSYSNIEINQSTPWDVDYHANVVYNVTDLTNTAVFSRNMHVSSSVNIIEFKDPLYTIFTNGQIIRAINITPYEGNYASGLGTANLKAHINGLFYTNSTGPSYLMRLEGNLGNSSAGIESIVRLPDLQEQELPIFERSSVDYVYFGESNPPIFVINSTFEDWFRLDDAHLAKYQVEDMTE